MAKHSYLDENFFAFTESDVTDEVANEAILRAIDGARPTDEVSVRDTGTCIVTVVPASLFPEALPGFESVMTEAVDLGAFEEDTQEEYTRGIVELIMYGFMDGMGILDGYAQDYIIHLGRERSA